MNSDNSAGQAPVNMLFHSGCANCDRPDHDHAANAKKADETPEAVSPALVFRCVEVTDTQLTI